MNSQAQLAELQRSLPEAPKTPKAPPRKPRRQALHSTYYDTPEHSLQQQRSIPQQVRGKAGRAQEKGGRVVRMKAGGRRGGRLGRSGQQLGGPTDAP